MYRLVSVFLSFTPRRDENQRSGNDTLDTRHHTNCTCIHTHIKYFNIPLYYFPIHNYSWAPTAIQLYYITTSMYINERKQAINRYITFTLNKVETESFDPSYFCLQSRRNECDVITLHLLIFLFFFLSLQLSRIDVICGLLDIIKVLAFGAAINRTIPCNTIE